MLLADLGLKNYDDVKKQRNRVDMTNTRAEKFLNEIIEQATHKRRQLNGVKTPNILLHKKEAMTEQDLIVQNKQVDDRRVPNEQVRYHKQRLETKKDLESEKETVGV